MPAIRVLVMKVRDSPIKHSQHLRAGEMLQATEMGQGSTCEEERLGAGLLGG